MQDEVTMTPPQVNAATLRRIAVESDADPRTVARVIRGFRAHGMVDSRIRRALAAHGLAPAENPTP